MLLLCVLPVMYPVRSGYSEQCYDHEQHSCGLGSPAGVAELPPWHSHVEEGGGLLEHGGLLFLVNTSSSESVKHRRTFSISRSLSSDVNTP